ncbi:MAG: phosphatase PAP2 family protein [Synergistaceae bacterium]|jgi:undecaprenyl-diphosphatase|nr:phosphatase PAP2 family protein [Synergistaceae bacterium]
MPEYLQKLKKMDASVLNWVQAHTKTAAMDHAMLFFTRLGDRGAIWIIYAAICAYNAKLRLVGIHLTICVSACVFLGHLAIKPMFMRTRPCNIDREHSMLLPRPKDSSFPSCHAMTSFAAAVVTAWQAGGFLGVTSLVLASAISFSRVYLYVHYPSDVVAGMTFGVAIGSLFVMGAA